MRSIVLDSSAALAMILGESGGERVMEAILAQELPIAISAVNWCEILTRLQRVSPIVNAERLAAMLPGVEVVPFGLNEADTTARLAKNYSALSLGDRACLTLASSRNATAWTTDRIWARMDVGAELQMLR